MIGCDDATTPIHLPTAAQLSWLSKPILSFTTPLPSCFHWEIVSMTNSPRPTKNLVNYSEVAT